ncbi:hypothetical protein Vadar_028297 [Vaccinium darrowii]|uniref:Uncharacterized protein n=1 Tax=Vaccinium darrowii TaxID=229202 RepID=A0ACB7Z764_9ERIC|nr:hypothetical protein Vadar_028297 [Vaccinium darrowii]
MGALPLVQGQGHSFGLALQWSPSFCLYAVTSPIGCGSSFTQTDEFYIHGLWTSDQADLPFICTRSNTPKLVSPNLRFMMPTGQLLMNLQSLWPNLKAKGTIAKIWKHEYEKHGICYMISSNYFTKALVAYDDVLIEMKVHVGSSLYHSVLLPLGNF